MWISPPISGRRSRAARISPTWRMIKYSQSCQRRTGNWQVWPRQLANECKLTRVYYTIKWEALGRCIDIGSSTGNVGIVAPTSSPYFNHHRPVLGDIQGSSWPCACRWLPTAWIREQRLECRSCLELQSIRHELAQVLIIYLGITASHVNMADAGILRQHSSF